MSDATCTELVSAAQVVAGIQVEDLRARAREIGSLEDIERLAKEQGAEVDRFQTDNEDCSNALQPTLLGISKMYTNALETVVAANKARQEIENKGIEIARGVSRVKEVLEDRQAFVECHTVGSFNDPVEVDVTIKRRRLGSTGSFEIMREFTIYFGGRPRFALSAGPVVSSLNDVSFDRVTSVVDTNGSPVVVGRVGLTNQSENRVLPMIAIHGRLFAIENLWTFGDLGFHVTLGSALHAVDQGTELEYLFGISLSGCEERLFLTWGEYVGRVQELDGGWHLGDDLPAEVAQIPIHKRWVLKPAFTLGFKFR
jgi:hypothetical protein